ncbi:MAG: DUF2971 domain-containing protein [Bacteroidetes bacterium]|jgi:hypothetical protein|nr:DUF2971 domain-containing protein [Bacteroidota bacterium]
MDSIAEALSQTPETPIYHYTSPEGLIGILQNGELWASNIHHLNDSSEMDYAFQLLKTRLKDRNVQMDEGRGELFKAFERWIDSIKSVNVFIGSFSERPNLLSQWRAYCPPSGGYSIGFSYRDLQPHLQRQGFLLVKCIYSEQTQSALVDKYVDWALKEIKTKKIDVVPDDELAAWFQLAKPARKIAGEFLRIAAALKDPSFEEECEWRIVSSGFTKYTDAMVDFRPGVSFVVPYFRFKLSGNDAPMSFRDIYVGPTPHPSVARKSIQGLITQVYEGRMEDILLEFGNMVKLSDIPYRTW